MKPRATYRLQCHKEFGFERVREIADYLARLGVSHIYSSPWLKARPGTRHGYDIIDHRSLNPELGDQTAFEQMIEVLNSKRIGRILDCVPNHMGVGGSDNPLWLDVLEWGRDSNYAGWFDIDWQPDRFALRDKLLIPLLGKQYGIELHSGKLTLKFDPEEGSFAIWAYDVHKLPVCPLHYQRILGDASLELERLGDSFATIQEWRPQITRRAQELKQTLAQCARESAGVRRAIDEGLLRFNCGSQTHEERSDLNLLIQDQHWRVAHFRVAGDDINYRRFFDNNELAGIRVELPEVFEHAHSILFRFLDDGTLDGLRIDHIDGLLDPKSYLRRLRDSAGGSFYLVVEKILAQHETLRAEWPVDGTTGYEFTNSVLGLLVDPSGEKGLTECYGNFTGERRTFAEVGRDCKIRIMRNEMASELNVLAREAARIAYQTPETADFTQNVLRRAIREIAAGFHVYRTYVDGDSNPTTDDRRDLQWAMNDARRNATDIDPSVFDFLEAVLSADLVTNRRSGFSRHTVLRFSMKFQQYTGPVMAKGIEDTAFYRYNRLIALNEVGGNPDVFGISVTTFHKSIAQRARLWPDSMLATSTHDTKRGEDTRARLAVLSEIPEQWAKQIRLWNHMLRARRRDIEAAAPPDANDEYLFYQMLVGSWPTEVTDSGGNTTALRDYAERLKQAMRKSIREAKVHSTWASPNVEYEDAVLSFVDGSLDPIESRAFLGEFLPFQLRLARLGAENSLVQTVLKLTVPGVPDMFQGSELWDLNLVDPDNRRPIDYQLRMQSLDELEAASCPVQDLMSNWQDGKIKLFVIWRILRVRAEDPALFECGEYEPLLAEGPKADQLCGFARLYENRALLVLAARFPARRELDSSWNGTRTATPERIGSKTFRNIFTGRKFSSIDLEGALDLVFDGLAVAVLTTEN